MTAPTPSSHPLPETFRDCLDFLYRRNQFSVKLGLESINALLDCLGRPDRGMTFLHVAGTNGKGSVCANLAALLGAAGHKRVGLYTSPHLVSFRERILVDGEPIPADWIVAWLRGAMGYILELNTTYFECVTAMALDYFKAARCEAVVLETGLGGRLDATNAVQSALTVVTSISLDHTSILGNTREAIWGEKIAILKPGIPMVVREDGPHLLAALEAKAAALGCPVYTLRDYPWTEVPAGLPGAGPPGAGDGAANRTAQAAIHGDPGALAGGNALRFQGRYATYVLPASLRSEAHQRENLALSLLAMEIFLKGPLPVPALLVPALRASKVPGRTQLLEESGMLPLILDGAHNPGGMAALKAHLRLKFPDRRIVALFSVMRDKDFAAVFRSVKGFASDILFLSLEDRYPRALSYADLEAALSSEERKGLRPFPLEAVALENLLRIPASHAEGEAPYDLAVACGSLYLLGEVIPMLLPHYRGLERFRQFVGES
ncbi:MAG: hypothetical protein M3Y08_03645 [Fibrobacterota bacterium]|nr:hypothetical protein [Fibrobacterota bacterium]